MTLKVKHAVVARLERGRFTFTKPDTPFLRKMLKREGGEEMRPPFVVISDGHCRMLCEVDHVQFVARPNAQRRIRFHVSGWGYLA